MIQRVIGVSMAAMVAVVAAMVMDEQASDKGAVPPMPKEIKLQRGLSEVEKECLACHAKEEPGKVYAWTQSPHGKANVTCLDCHAAKLTDKDAVDCPGTAKYDELKISPLVTPGDCSKCHPSEAEQFAKSKHAGTWKIQTDELQDPWLKGMANEVERAAGCYMCHGSDLSSGKLDELSWPNQGCGRKNPDGSLGSCVMCHTTHTFSVAEARKPESCGQCHLGPDHPQDEIYFESKHGKLYLAHGDDWNFESAPEAWEPSSDFIAPTCAACHMAGIGPLATTHNVGERLKWEAQLPLSVLNKDLDGETARGEMLTVCAQCHSPKWGKSYLARYDKVIENYNVNYFLPIKTKMDGLYASGKLTKWPVFDEEIEWVFYEFWHHEGRRARMGAAMMGPDYSWWHGFYDLKKSFQHFMKLADEVEEKGHGSPYYVPGATGKNLTPAAVAPLPAGWSAIPNLGGAP